MALLLFETDVRFDPQQATLNVWSIGSDACRLNHHVAAIHIKGAAYKIGAAL